MDWVHSAGSVQELGAGVTSCRWVLTPDKAQQDFTDPTLMRSRFAVQVANRATIPSLVQAPGAAVSMVAVGLIRWQGVPLPRTAGPDEPLDQTQDAALPSPCPDPLVDAELDWIWRFIFMFHRGAAALSAISNGGGGQGDVESLAKRRLGNDGGLLFSFSNWTAINVDIQWDVRCLMKE